MALDSYSALIDSVGSWLNRRDLASQIPDFVRLVEDDLALKLRDRRMHRTVDATISAEPLALPDDWLEAVRISGAGDGRALLPATPGQLQGLRARRMGYGGTYVAGDPLPGTTARYAISGNSLELYPAPTQPLTLSMTYYQRIPRLSADAPSNWLLQDDPGVYLYGALIQAAPYLKDDARIATWAALYRDRVDNRNQASAAAEYSGGPLRRTRRGFR